MTRSATAEQEPTTIGDDGPLVEFLGEIPCPTKGCKGRGQRVRFAGKLVIENACPECVARSERDREIEERAEVARRLRLNAGETPRLAEFSIDSYPTDQAGKAALAAAVRWRDGILSRERDAPRNLFLHGPAGSGKTGLLWPVVASLCDELVEARLVDFPTLLEQMKDAYSKRVPLDRFTDLGRVPVLVLDDVGAERPTEWARAQLLHLVNQRYERLKFTAFASNYDPDTLAKRLGQDDPVVGVRIISRITESCIQHRMEAGDRRLG